MSNPISGYSTDRRNFFLYHSKLRKSSAPAMAPWPSDISRLFLSLPANPSESDFYAPYNKLLSTLFPVDTAFTVAPQPHLVADSGNSITILVEYVVFYEDKPVFILEITNPSKLRLLSAREDGDNQIRRRIRDLRATCPLPTLHAVSAFGTKLCFYNAKAGWSIAPPKIPPHAELMSDTAPQSRWDCDLTEDEGAIRLKEVVNEIRNQCENL